MAPTDRHPERDDQGPDTTPGIPPSRPAPLLAQPVADPDFRPPARDGLSGLSLGLAAAVVVLGLYALVNWPWSDRNPVPETGVAQAAAAPAEPPAPAAAEPAPPQVPAPAEPASPQAGAPGVNRCEKPGEVSYVEGPCPAGTRSTPVDTSAAVSVEGGRGTTLYRCRGAGQFWSVLHCQHRGAEVVSLHTVPADLSLAEQILFARNRQALLRPPRPATEVAAPATPPTAVSLKAAECRRLDTLVALLDDYARQPLSPREQDSVRRDRKKLRDQQFGLRCGR
jgi:hypothetical protein